jgi:hypothetical protein
MASRQARPSCHLVDGVVAGVALVGPSKQSQGTPGRCLVLRVRPSRMTSVFGPPAIRACGSSTMDWPVGIWRPPRWCPTVSPVPRLGDLLSRHGLPHGDGVGQACRSRMVADAFGGPVLRDQGPIGRPGSARPMQALTDHLLAKPRAGSLPAERVNGAGRGPSWCCPWLSAGTSHVCCEWHACGTVDENNDAPPGSDAVE